MSRAADREQTAIRLPVGLKEELQREADRQQGSYREEFSARSPGMAMRVRSSKASKEPGSSTSLGMSSLAAIHTLASLSQVK